ncbi:hypothetical protein MFMK1_003624 [Metallumcola ferriviriculae]|uniref:Uncharacterized protein n=1 Tax=Metallumcola ferriviriculae TaxID=3039180 RepID=A0AAU0USC0_9FIRM|nr:hypothetical protein MFMK1_003624 [Desulfitibacteraceae bacterium MK1]
MKKGPKIILVLMAAIGVPYYTYVNIAIQETKAVPLPLKEAILDFDDSGLALNHDAKGTLYIINNGPHELTMYSLLKSYKIDAVDKEIVIHTDALNANPRNDFQVMKIPEGKYKDIVFNGRVKVRVEFFRGHMLYEYDLANKRSRRTEHAFVGK